MSFELRISPEVFDELADAIDFYNVEIEGLGFELEEEFFNGLAEISKGPLLFQIRYLNIRIFWLHRFPFGIHYFVDQNFIIVSAVIHASRNPHIWTQRLKD